MATETAKPEPSDDDPKAGANAESGEERDGFLYPVSIGVIVLGLVAAVAFLPRILPHGRDNGADAPDFSVPFVANADGKTTFQLSEYKGHPVLLDFWATWCGPCKAETPIVNRIAERYKDRGLVVVGMNTSDEPGAAAPYAKAHGFTFPMAFDQKNVGARAFDVSNLPTMVLISKTGKIIAVRMGLTSDDEIDRLVRAAL